MLFSTNMTDEQREIRDLPEEEKVREITFMILDQLKPSSEWFGPLEIRFVKGTSPSHTAKDAENNKSWADMVLVWVPSEVKHKVTSKYIEGEEGLVTILVQRRGVGALFQETVEFF